MGFLQRKPPPSVNRVVFPLTSCLFKNTAPPRTGVTAGTAAEASRSGSGAGAMVFLGASPPGRPGGPPARSQWEGCAGLVKEAGVGDRFSPLGSGLCEIESICAWFPMKPPVVFSAGRVLVFLVRF